MANSLWKFIFWPLALATLWLSLVPVEHIPTPFNFWDKAQHALGFTALALTGLASYPGQRTRLLLGLVLFGVGTEYSQHLSGWRQGDWADWVADCVGIAVGAMVWRAFQHKTKAKFD